MENKFHLLGLIQHIDLQHIQIFGNNNKIYKLLTSYMAIFIAFAYSVFFIEI